MAGLLVAYRHHFHRRYSYIGHLRQGRYKAAAIECDAYLLSCGRYVERNPVEAGLTELPWEYGGSSCRAYALGQVDPLVTDSPCFVKLAPSQDRRAEQWRAFLVAEDPREEELRRIEGVARHFGGGLRKAMAGRLRGGVGVLVGPTTEVVHFDATWRFTNRYINCSRVFPLTYIPL
jgi:hypothetical protein